jgi:hypothetical protein
MAWRVIYGMAWIAAVVGIPYFAVQSLVVARATVVPISFVDAAIPFSPEWSAVYLSFYLLLPLPLFLREDNAFFFRTVLCTSLLTHLIFLLFPTQIVRPSITEAVYTYRFIMSVDGVANACPSLHASLGFLAVITCTAVWKQGLASLLMWIWYAAVLYAALAVKQHVVLDLVMGIVVGMLVIAVNSRWSAT